MNDDVRRSRLMISRRRALSLGATVGFAGLLAACTGDEPSASGPSSASPAVAASSAAASSDEVLTLLEKASTCTMAREETQGPYWFDVDTIRRDVREQRPGTTLHLAVRALDQSSCHADGSATPLENSVIEIWHCDAGGAYSGFESSSGGGPGGGGPGDGSGGETSDGSYSVGDAEAQTGDDGTYLRGAQVADPNGVVRFTTVYPGWYRGRTTHIHVKVHVDKKTVLTTQLYFDDDLNDAVYGTSPYDDHSGRDTRNNDDGIFDTAGLVSVSEHDDGYLAVINLGV